MDWLVLSGGVGLVLLALTDLFLTVLYPRSGKGVLSMSLSKGIWRFFRLAARSPLCDRDRLLSYCGPTLLVAIVVVWTLFLIGGFALISSKWAFSQQEPARAGMAGVVLPRRRAA